MDWNASVMTLSDAVICLIILILWGWFDDIRKYFKRKNLKRKELE